MQPTSTSVDPLRERSLFFLATPTLWQLWPFIPVIRRKPGEEEELGVVYDALHAINLPGHACTVFFCNVFLLPDSVAELLAMRREVYDTFEQIVDAGWRVD